MAETNVFRRMQGWVLAFVVILMSVVFLTQFGGPQAQGCSEGGATYAAKVYGETISEGDFRAAFMLANRVIKP